MALMVTNPLGQFNETLKKPESAWGRVCSEGLKDVCDRLGPHLGVFGAPGGDRTHNLQLRRLTLCPIELQARKSGE